VYGDARAESEVLRLKYLRTSEDEYIKVPRYLLIFFASLTSHDKPKSDIFGSIVTFPSSHTHNFIKIFSGFRSK
jgi:hypothetical protein